MQLRAMRPRRALIAAAIAAAIAASPASAQQVLPVEPAAPPYDEQLLRLSEILGAIHYLRHLCGHDEEETWRDEMAALIEAEEPDGLRRARMIDRFNRGYEGFRAIYRDCTPAANESAGRYLNEGARIAADITARYSR
jgi:uncharacterized protein (TIGR02301 family)